MPVSRQILRPVSLRFILATFLAALFVNLMPWPPTRFQFLPDFVALILLYWNLNQPRRVRVGTAFFLGLLMDVAGGGGLLGQHALAYVVISGLMLVRQRRVAVFPFWQQATLVLGLLLLAQLLMLLVRLIFGASFIGWSYFFGCFIAAFLWTPMSNLMLWRQRRAVPDEI